MAVWETIPVHSIKNNEEEEEASWAVLRCMRAEEHLKKRDITLKEQYSGAVGYLPWLQALNGAARAAEFLFLVEGFQSVGYYGRRTRQ
ncbi:hypothetical protein DPMN_001553 [Dreissena polymorpha]|uniref:Uncharacterized protein n=1 Tax=Dreissena polymorpha TaxID=45954 RepID=A0A9D4MLX0_DREPO|nr:hypothetical protein DPMN_001553 [Dreissena polymorpha]